MPSKLRSAKSHLLNPFLIFILGIGVLVATYTSGQAKMSATNLSGVVAGSYFTPSASSTPARREASYYSGTKVCVDSNNDGACSLGEPSTTTGADGSFTLNASAGPIVAEVAAGASNGGHVVARPVVFRATKEQVAESLAAGRRIVVSPLSTEVVRMMESNALAFSVAKANLAQRLGVTPEQVLGIPNESMPQNVKTALLTESVILTGRFTMASTMARRGDPAAAGMKEAEQAAMNLEGIPRYDHLFIIMLENKATSSIKNSPFAPKINAYLNEGNEFTSYYATGNPSEPNYTALAAADDFGITDDEDWNCVPEGDTAALPEDPLPEGMFPCTNRVSHNIKNKANLFTALNAAGMTWRVYSESMNPGRDWRLGGRADPTLVARDHVYPASSPVGAIGNEKLMLPFPEMLYATKHNPAVPFQNVRSSPEWKTSQRTMGGGQWDEAIRNSPKTPESWDVDQLGTDLQANDIANLNFLVPDQCDDMHGVKFGGTVAPSPELIPASDCSGNPITYRGDNYVDYLIRKILQSTVWKNQQKRVAIVIMFDEGTATTGFNSCCGWNPSAGPKVAGKSLGILSRKSDAIVNMETIAGYNLGNKGHGTSVFGVLTNQPQAPKHVIDSDAYSHFSFVRTLQDMFQLADPGDDWSYMNRSKYTERFIAANIANLPEFADSADPHFDAVRPMNHQFVIPQGYAQKNGFPKPQIGPDANQLNAWAIK